MKFSIAAFSALLATMAAGSVIRDGPPYIAIAKRSPQDLPTLVRQNAYINKRSPQDLPTLVRQNAYIKA